MNCNKIIEILETAYPLHLAEAWDNPGLLVGRRDKEVKTIYIALDATDDIIGEALKAGADMLITHHPMWMSPVSAVTTEEYTGRRIIKLIQNDISYYALHTNHDVVTMAPLAGQMMQLRHAKIMVATAEEGTAKTGFGQVGELPGTMNLRECAEYVKEIFELDTVKVFGTLTQQIDRVAVLPGSGKSFVADAIKAGAQVIISGDFGHHDGIDALMKGIAVIDAGHYGLEHIFIPQMVEFLQRKFPALKINCESIKNPFQVI